MISSKASVKRLQFCNFKLDFLLKITQAINDNLSTEDLLEKFVTTLKNDLNIGKILVYSFNKEWNCILQWGFEKSISEKIGVESDLFPYTDISYITTTDNELLAAFDVIIPVYHHEKPIAYVIIGDIDEERAGISPTIKHLHFIQTLTNVIMVAIENKRVFQEYLRQEKIKRELELASKMQAMLIPSPDSLPHTDDLFVSAYYSPHFDVGGDYYDFIQLDEKTFGFCVADVSGKGFSAALLMSNFQANLRALFTPKDRLNQLVEKLNIKVMKSANGEKFITLFIGKYDAESKELQYINAGHNPPVLYNKETKKCQLLTNGCIGVGMFDEIPKIVEEKIELAKGSKLVCFTDGIVEMEDDNQVEFGTIYIEKVIAESRKMDTIIEDIIEELNQFRGKNEFFDDITIMGIDFF